MNQLNDGQRHEVDEYPATRIAFLVEETDVGIEQGQYLGQHNYTFEPKDVGRLVEVVMEKSPGFVSWQFGSIFRDLRDKYPDPFPYIGAPSASE